MLTFPECIAQQALSGTASMHMQSIQQSCADLQSIHPLFDVHCVTLLRCSCMDGLTCMGHISSMAHLVVVPFFLLTWG